MSWIRAGLGEVVRLTMFRAFRKSTQVNGSENLSCLDIGHL